MKKTSEDNRIMRRNVYIRDAIRLESEKEGKLEGLQEGKLEGGKRAHQTVFEIAGGLIQDGKSNSEIQRYTNLSLDEIRQLRNSS